MPRTKRVTPGGMVFHALNRGVGRMEIFRTERDYAAFEETIEETLRLDPMRILAYCLLPTHWHFVLWPAGDGDLSAFLQRLTNTHTQRWQRAKNKVGHGHLYQSRFKSFPVWTQIINQPQTEAELNAIRRCILRSCPYGSDGWVQSTASSLGLESTLRPRGRPKATQEPRQR